MDWTLESHESPYRTYLLRALTVPFCTVAVSAVSLLAVLSVSESVSVRLGLAMHTYLPGTQLVICYGVAPSWPLSIYPCALSLSRSWVCDESPNGYSQRRSPTWELGDWRVGIEEFDSKAETPLVSRATSQVPLPHIIAACPAVSVFARWHSQSSTWFHRCHASTYLSHMRIDDSQRSRGKPSSCGATARRSVYGRRPKRGIILVSMTALGGARGGVSLPIHH
ncbi:hypothetical protein GGR52DRAFT_525965 [Hypoxylon sp. FL1284]|nr:hypothetical protein GGR52DRAFT_525965 [Hypoxylon sp. FL1284]